MNTYTTYNDLVNNYFADALNGVEENFDVDAFANELRDLDIITTDEAGRYYVDETRDDEFWALVERYDAAAQA